MNFIIKKAFHFLKANRIAREVAAHFYAVDEQHLMICLPTAVCCHGSFWAMVMEALSDVTLIILMISGAVSLVLGLTVEEGVRS
jgi:hypothetical protein